MTHKCQKCNANYRHPETAYLCCRERGGCGKKETPQCIITHVCGETINDGRYYFCKSCQRKKQNNWRTASIISE